MLTVIFVLWLSNCSGMTPRSLREGWTFFDRIHNDSLPVSHAEPKILRMGLFALHSSAQPKKNARRHEAPGFSVRDPWCRPWKLMTDSAIVYFQLESPELFREVMLAKPDAFSGRPNFVRFKAYMRFQESIAMSSDTPTWKLKKKAYNTSMKMWVLKKRYCNKGCASKISSRQTVGNWHRTWLQKYRRLQIKLWDANTARGVEGWSWLLWLLNKIKTWAM